MSTASVACGVLGMGGNKGAVAVSFSLYRRRIAFVCSHFAAHQVPAPVHNLTPSHSCAYFCCASGLPRCTISHPPSFLLLESWCCVNKLLSGHTCFLRMIAHKS